MNTAPIEFLVYENTNPIIGYTEVENFKGALHKVSIKDDFLHFVANHEKNYNIMQLTAIRSINNEPIYNHMIVKSELWGYFIVDMFDYELMYDLSKTKLEIVGNRFQHPELLKLCK